MPCALSVPRACFVFMDGDSVVLKWAECSKQMFICCSWNAVTALYWLQYITHIYNSPCPLPHGYVCYANEAFTSTSVTPAIFVKDTQIISNFWKNSLEMSWRKIHSKNFPAYSHFHSLILSLWRVFLYSASGHTNVYAANPATLSV